MQSMTGYGYIEKSTHQFSFSIEVKSLNSKFLEIFINLPKILRKEENNLTQILKDKFGRGKIVLTIEVFDWKEERKISINKNALKEYYRELKSIENELKIDGFFSGDTLFSFNNIIHVEDTLLSNQSYMTIMKTLNNVVEIAVNMRKKEGGAIKKDLQNSLNIIHENLINIKKGYKDISKVIFERLKKSINSITGTEVNDGRLYTEVAILVDKLDINEETVRLDNHIKKFRNLLNNREQIGKRLDFLAQEMFREANTIASKANSAEVSHMVITIKNHIDKIREHSRNII